MIRTSNRKKSRTSSALASNTSEFKYVPPELWTRIFATSPVKTLVRFRSVCKLWCSIIDDPDFVHMHTNNRSRTNKLLLSFEGLGRTETSDPYVFTIREAETLKSVDQICITNERYDIHGSCNGLILVHRWRSSSTGEELRVWNPSIRKSLVLPRFPVVPYLHRAWYVFGFAPRSQKYKVAVFGIDHLIVGVYTLGDKKWVRRNNMDVCKVLNYHSSLSDYSSYYNPFYFQGATYWLGKDPNSDNVELTYLVSFDFDTENFSFLKLPYVSTKSNYKHSWLFLLGESLAIFCISYRYSNIWVLRQDDGKGRWTEWFSGPASKKGFLLFELDFFRDPIFYFEKDGGRYFIRGNKTYNIDSRRVKEVNKSMKESYPIYLETYSESLMLRQGYGAEELRSLP